MANWFITNPTNTTLTLIRENEGVKSQLNVNVNNWYSYSNPLLIIDGTRYDTYITETKRQLPSDFTFKSSNVRVYNQYVSLNGRDIMFRLWNDLANNHLYPTPKNIAIAIAYLNLINRARFILGATAPVPEFELDQPPIDMMIPILNPDYLEASHSTFNMVEVSNA